MFSFADVPVVRAARLLIGQEVFSKSTEIPPSEFRAVVNGRGVKEKEYQVLQSAYTALCGCNDVGDFLSSREEPAGSLAGGFRNPNACFLQLAKKAGEEYLLYNDKNRALQELKQVPLPHDQQTADAITDVEAELLTFAEGAEAKHARFVHKLYSTTYSPEDMLGTYAGVGRNRRRTTGYADRSISLRVIGLKLVGLIIIAAPYPGETVEDFLAYDHLKDTALSCADGDDMRSLRDCAL
jgi:hypothetical protein